jgi:hypothetical protein
LAISLLAIAQTVHF